MGPEEQEASVLLFSPILNILMYQRHPTSIALSIHLFSGAEKGLLQSHARRQVPHALKSEKLPRGFRRSTFKSQVREGESQDLWPTCAQFSDQIVPPSIAFKLVVHWWHPFQHHLYSTQVVKINSTAAHQAKKSYTYGQEYLPSMSPWRKPGRLCPATFFLQSCGPNSVWPHP